MPSFRRAVVVRDAEKTSDVPEWANEGLVHVEWLNRWGFFDELGERFLVQREGGYAAEDLLLFSLYHLTGGVGQSIKEFGDRCRLHGEKLAAVAGRKRLPSPSSMSRGLRAVTEESLAGLPTWLLLEATKAEEMLWHPALQTRDVLGGTWHVFDNDETVTTLRQRGLPEREDTPAARRRSADMAAPGYSGRKRGDVQISRATLQHAGSGLWVGCWTGPGNGDRRAWTKEVVGATVATCERANIAPDRGILRYDGAGGNVPFIEACQSASVRFLTRLARYELLEQPEIAERLDKAVWYRVPSESGPERQAVDLGYVTLTPSPTTRRSDGSRYDPVETRVVVSRYDDPRDHGAGRRLGGWRYELYACDLPVESWPAAETVALYYGRVAEENRFAQEDRELRLDRIFSYHLPGQAFATLVGLFIWNLRLIRGFELVKPPPHLPPQSPRSIDVAEPPETGLRAALGLLPKAPPTDNPDEEEQPESLPPRNAPAATLRRWDDEELRVIRDEAAAAVRSSGYVPPVDWRWDDEEDILVCPNGAPLVPSFIDRYADPSTVGIRYQASQSACSACPRPAECTTSTAPDFRRRVRINVAAGAGLDELEARLKKTNSARRRAGQHARRSARTAACIEPAPREPAALTPCTLPQPDAWRPVEHAHPGTLLAVMIAILLPAVLRHAFRRACRDLHARVVVTQRRPAPLRVACYAYHHGERQHQRLSWAQRRKWNALTDSAEVAVTLQAPRLLKPLLTEEPGDFVHPVGEPP